MNEKNAPALPPGIPPFLTTAEVGRLHRVDSKTVARWAKEGKIESVRNPGRGGQRRFPAVQFAGLLMVSGWPV